MTRMSSDHQPIPDVHELVGFWETLPPHEIQQLLFAVVERLALEVWRTNHNKHAETRLELRLPS